MMNHLQKNQGYSLVEVLVSIAVLLLALVGPMTIAAKGIQSAIFSKEQTTAMFLAQEGVEMVIALRNQFALLDIGGVPNTAWDDWVDGSSATADVLNRCESANGCSLYFSSSQGNIYSISCPAAGCPINYSDSAMSPSGHTPTPTARYHYLAAGSGSGNTPFRRRVTVEAVDDASGKYLEVTSTVTWASNLFGSSRSVTLTSIVYNLYEL